LYAEGLERDAEGGFDVASSTRRYPPDGWGVEGVNFSPRKLLKKAPGVRRYGGEALFGRGGGVE
jgi:hypothetical protein